MRTRRRDRSRLRRSLSSWVQEGLFAEVFNACAGPTILVGWALRLGCTPLEVGLVGTLPQPAQVVQLPAAWATALLGGRRVALVTVTLSRQAYLPFALLAVVPVPPHAARALLLGGRGRGARRSRARGAARAALALLPRPYGDV